MISGISTETLRAQSRRSHCSTTFYCIASVFTLLLPLPHQAHAALQPILFPIRNRRSNDRPPVTTQHAGNYMMITQSGTTLVKTLRDNALLKYSDVPGSFSYDTFYSNSQVDSSCLSPCSGLARYMYTF